MYDLLVINEKNNEKMFYCDLPLSTVTEDEDKMRTNAMNKEMKI